MLSLRTKLGRHLVIIILLVTTVAGTMLVSASQAFSSAPYRILRQEDRVTLGAVNGDANLERYFEYEVLSSTLHRDPDADSHRGHLRVLGNRC